MTEHSFIDIDCYGEVTGTRYACQLEVKMALTFKEQKEEAIADKRLCVGLDRTDSMFVLFSVWSRVDSHLVGDKPSWWNAENMVDTEPVYEIAKKITDLQKEVAAKRSGVKTEETK